MNYSGLGVQQVWDCTGVFLTRASLAPYFDAHGVPKVVVSAPVKDAAQPVLNIVYGVNHVSSVWLAGWDRRVCGVCGCGCVLEVIARGIVCLCMGVCLCWERERG